MPSPIQNIYLTDKVLLGLLNIFRQLLILFLEQTIHLVEVNITEKCMDG